MPRFPEFAEYITLTQASHVLPGRPSRSALERWRTRGIRGVRLATWLVGGRRYTSIAALDEFLRAVTSAGDGQQIHQPQPTANDILDAERALDQFGV